MFGQQVAVKCYWCEKIFFRHKNRYNEAIRKNWHQCCSTNCMSIYKKKAAIFFKLNITLPTIEDIRNQEYKCKLCDARHDGSYASGIFCGQHCSKKFSASVNKEEVNKKVAETLKNRDLGHPRFVNKTCLNCNKEFFVRWYSQSQNCCSNKCARKLSWKNENYRVAITDAQKELVVSGKHKGWATRNKLKPSYPEQYFINVLKNYNINFNREIKIGKYFADFVLDNKIVLEIDGSQHEFEDRKKRDREKDLYLTSNGWKVIRIKWKNPKNDKNKIYIKEQIDMLLKEINYSCGILEVPLPSKQM